MEPIFQKLARANRYALIFFICVIKCSVFRVVSLLLFLLSWVRAINASTNRKWFECSVRAGEVCLGSPTDWWNSTILFQREGAICFLERPFTQISFGLSLSIQCSRATLQTINGWTEQYKDRAVFQRTEAYLWDKVKNWAFSKLHHQSHKDLT